VWEIGGLQCPAEYGDGVILGCDIVERLGSARRDFSKASLSMGGWWNVLFLDPWLKFVVFGRRLLLG